MTENERIKLIRKSKEVNLTLEKFGNKLGVKKAAISKIENGENAVTDQMRRSICREFGVNEKWLRTGEGEIFHDAQDSLLSRAASELSQDPFVCSIIVEYFKLDEEGRRLLREYTQNVAEGAKSSRSAPGAAWALTTTADTEPADEDLKPDTPDEAEERRLLHEELDRELDAEKEAGERSQALLRIG